jgi:hypothetical protein
MINLNEDIRSGWAVEIHKINIKEVIDYINNYNKNLSIFIPLLQKQIEIKGKLIEVLEKKNFLTIDELLNDLSSMKEDLSIICINIGSMTRDGDMLNELEKISKTFTVDVWIPSLKKNIKFKQIDAKQQKDILSSAMDTSVYNTSFVKTFYEIIKYNILPESNINLDEFTLVDKISIGLTLKEQITDELMLFFGEDKKEITQKFKIKPILDKLKQYEIQFKSKFEVIHLDEDNCNLFNRWFKKEHDLIDRKKG